MLFLLEKLWNERGGKSGFSGPETIHPLCLLIRAYNETENWICRQQTGRFKSKKPILKADEMG
jgi:hypothetical protein